jgi:hypothetical protein
MEIRERLANITYSGEPIKCRFYGSSYAAEVARPERGRSIDGEFSHTPGDAGVCILEETIERF